MWRSYTVVHQQKLTHQTLTDKADGSMMLPGTTSSELEVKVVQSSWIWYRLNSWKVAFPCCMRLTSASKSFKMFRIFLAAALLTRWRSGIGIGFGCIFCSNLMRVAWDVGRYKSARVLHVSTTDLFVRGSGWKTTLKHYHSKTGKKTRHSWILRSYEYIFIKWK